MPEYDDILNKMLLPETTKEEKKELVEALPLNDKDKEVVQKIVTSSNDSELESLIAEFNTNQRKKNALRIIKLDRLREKLEDEAMVRVETRPGQMSNKELLEFITSISGEIEDSRDVVKSIPEQQMIKPVNSQVKNEITVNLGTDYTKSDKENAANAIQQIMALIAASTQAKPSQPIQDDEVTLFPNNVEVTTEDKK